MVVIRLTPVRDLEPEFLVQRTRRYIGLADFEQYSEHSVLAGGLDQSVYQLCPDPATLGFTSDSNILEFTLLAGDTSQEESQ